jgi:hypothetical protein
METFLLFIAGINPWILFVVLASIVCGLEVCCNVPTHRREEGTGDPELDREMDEIEKSLDDLNRELDQMQVRSSQNKTC